MSSFITGVWSTVGSIRSWILACAAMIRTNPFLLFTVGFVALGYVIAVFGRLLSRE